MNDSHTLIPMGVGEPEAVRCRVYGGEEVDPEEEAKRRAFVAKLADEGVIDCPAYDPWVAALQERGWLPARPDIEFYKAHVVGRWRLTAKGREGWAACPT